MSKTRSASFCVFLNLILPGLAQLVLGYYWRGLIQLSGAAGAFLVAAYFMLTTMINNLQMAFNDTGAQFETYNLRAIMIAGLVMTLLWLWSLAELPFLLMRKFRQQRDKEGMTP